MGTHLGILDNANLAAFAFHSLSHVHWKSWLAYTVYLLTCVSDPINNGSNPDMDFYQIKRLQVWSYDINSIVGDIICILITLGCWFVIYEFTRTKEKDDED